MKEDIFPADVREASDKMTGNWINAKEFEGGLTLQLTKPLERVQNRYGATEDDFLVERGLLSEGEVFQYTFNDMTGTERKFSSKSSPFFLGFKQCEDLGVGDWVIITRTGKTDKTRYTVEKVENPVVPAQKPVVEEGEVNPNDIPF